ncbi:MAG: glycosyltransferase family 2 protein [Chloroflexota bacterium]|nr:MAG: glycosyltransferase family 2 protein [Chloroflexota bacterium]
MATNSKIDLSGLPKSVDASLMDISLSICIVTYNARNWLSDCLESIFKNTQLAPIEIIVVDNGSNDGIGEMLLNEYPEVTFIENKSNLGYTRPMNQSLQAAQGRFIMQLNPDTLILPGSFDRMIGFMENHAEVGICGPKVLNQDGSFQQQCRRGEPRPAAMLGYFLRLTRIFPENRNLGGYLLNYEDENKTLEVDAVSGSCMLIRREVIDDIGYLDEQFFAYQEDTDFCTRARRSGWKVFYFPEAEIIHFGGRGGSRVHPYRSIVEWHRSYWRYYKKHLAQDYFFLVNWIYYLLMAIKLGLALGVNLFRRERYAGPRR